MKKSVIVSVTLLLLFGIILSIVFQPSVSAADAIPWSYKSDDTDDNSTGWTGNISEETLELIFFWALAGVVILAIVIFILTRKSFEKDIY